MGAEGVFAVSLDSGVGVPFPGTRTDRRAGGSEVISETPAAERRKPLTDTRADPSPREGETLG